MTPERWGRIEDLYHASLEQEPAARAGFLAGACGGDEDLRREVESLLAQDGTGKILNQSLGAVAADMLKPRERCAPGAMIGPYRIIEPLGAGGMGEVYRANDTRLGRDVALKFLPADQLSDPERRRRFLSEARSASALNHPNIVTFYDLISNRSENILVLECVRGRTLDRLIGKGGLRLKDTLAYAIQMADGLAAAHQAGIVHRDLKPSNVIVTENGTVKLLDFGLAKFTPVDYDPDRTKTLPTAEGKIVGTLQYMSPEQAQGKVVDARSDIFSFGLVFYEMITGKRAFEGANPASLIAAILEREAPALEPEALNRVVRACLAKDPADRFQTARDLKRAIEWSASGDGETTRPDGARRPWLAWSVAAVATLGLAAVAFLHFNEKPPEQNVLPELELSIVPPSGTNLLPVGSLNIDRISPDGSTVLYRADDARFHLRRLSSVQDQTMPPFDWYGDVFWSPDSKSIAFSTASGLMKMRAPNGAPELVAGLVVAGRGGTWGDKGIILVACQDSSPGGVSLYGVPVAGGKAFPIEVPGLKEGRYYYPVFLPGGDDFLFLFAPSDSAATQLYIATLRGGKAVDPRLLFNNEAAAAFTSYGGGRILFVRNDNLYAQKIDVKARRLIGDAELVQERVASIATTHSAYFSVSTSGALVWRSGTAVVSQVTAFDRKGNRTGTAGAAVPGSFISLAPDEAHILVTSQAGSWVMESNGPGRISLGSAAVKLLWWPDGSGLIGVRGAEIYRRSLTGSRENRSFPKLPGLAGRNSLHGISPDGRRILYSNGTSLLSFSLDGGGQPEQIVDQQVDNAAMSPDGAWTVYHPQTEPGIYVQPLTGRGLRRQIADNGSFAIWRADGKEILYVAQGRIWSVRVDGAGTQLRFAPPEPLFPVSNPLGLLSGARPLAVSRDGSRIYFLQSKEEPDSGVIQVRTRAIR